MLMRAHLERVRAMREADNRARTAATQTAGPAGENSAAEPAGPQGRQMTALLRAELARLHQIKSTDAKVEAKRKILPQFIPYVEGVLEADAAGEPADLKNAGSPAGADDVVTTVMVWCLDVGDYPRLFQIFAYVRRHGLSLPERYKRDPASFVVEELADRILGTLKAKGELDSAMVFALDTVLGDAHDLDIHDQTRAKANRALGKVAFEDAVLGQDLGGPVRAVDLLKEALRLDPKCGATGELKAAEKAVVKQNDAPEADTPATEQADTSA